jgi:hypothetical protein
MFLVVMTRLVFDEYVKLQVLVWLSHISVMNGCNVSYIKVVIHELNVLQNLVEI